MDKEKGDSFRGSLERMDRIQRDVQQLWASITGSEKNAETNEQNEVSIEKRFHSVWDNLHNYYNSRGNGSTIDGVIQSAHHRINRIGQYFKDIWQTGSDAFSHKLNIQSNRETVDSMKTGLNQHIKTMADSIADGIQSIKSSVDAFKSE
jgi:hypothetical protein